MPKMKTTEQFKKEVETLVEKRYTILSEYTGTREKLKIRHNICGNEYEVMPNKFLGGRRCPVCADKKRSEKHSISHDEFIKRLSKKTDITQYEFIDKYIDNETKLRVKHLSEKCGNKILRINPHDLMNGKGCEICNKNRWTKDTFNKKFQKKFSFQKDFVLSPDSFISRTKTVSITHSCGQTFTRRADTIMMDRFTALLCPKCDIHSSQPEKEIQRWLDDNNIDYEREKSLGCKNVLPLRFDFIIKLEDDNLFIIEYNGEQHYHDLQGYKFSSSSLKKNQNRDKIKLEFCKNRGIDILIIPYTKKKSIKRILEETFEI